MRKDFPVPGRNPFDDLEDFFSSMRKAMLSPMSNLSKVFATPSIDLKDLPDKYVAEIEIPGFTKDEIEIILKDGMLTVKGNKTQIEKEEDKTYVMRERRYSESFQRTITLPKNIDSSKASAKYENGLLLIELPKTEPPDDAIRLNIE